MTDQATPIQTDQSTAAAPDKTHVAAFGCPFAGRLFRALVPGPPYDGKRALTIPQCPGCGEGHAGLIHIGRERRPGESLDVCIDGAVDLGPPPEPKSPSPSSPTPPPAAPRPDHRQKFTDTELLAALTVEPQRSAAVARVLGAKVSGTISERCAALAGAEVIYQGAGRPTLVCKVPGA
jgi:hypothetical protein